MTTGPIGSPSRSIHAPRTLPLPLSNTTRYDSPAPSTSAPQLHIDTIISPVIATEETSRSSPTAATSASSPSTQSQPEASAAAASPRLQATHQRTGSLGSICVNSAHSSGNSSGYCTSNQGDIELLVESPSETTRTKCVNDNAPHTSYVGVYWMNEWWTIASCHRGSFPLSVSPSNSLSIVIIALPVFSSFVFHSSFNHLGELASFLSINYKSRQSVLKCAFVCSPFHPQILSSASISQWFFCLLCALCIFCRTVIGGAERISSLSQQFFPFPFPTSFEVLSHSSSCSKSYSFIHSFNFPFLSPSL